MFDFFKKVATGIGFKLIDNFSDKVADWIKEIFKKCEEVDSGYRTQNASSGDCTKNASSGDCTKNVISGKNSICFDCGYRGMIKAVKGTWISLAEYGKDEKNNCIPIYAKSAQIGNKEFKDSKGRTLKSNVWYMLWKKEFYQVEEYDGI